MKSSLLAQFLATGCCALLLIDCGGSPPTGSSPGVGYPTPTPIASAAAPWSCSVDVLSGQATVDLAGGGVVGTCGTGSPPPGANACTVDPPGQAAAAGWCEAGTNSPQPVPAIPSQQPVGVPGAGTSPVASSTFLCPASVQQGANFTTIASCGTGTAPAGAISPCFITTPAGQLVSGWCLP